jgi:hypothetical protein
MGAIPKRFRDALEGYLAYAPWRAGTGRVMGYREAINQGQIPGLTSKEIYAALEPYFIKVVALGEWFGAEFAESVERLEWLLKETEEEINGEA